MIEYSNEGWLGFCCGIWHCTFSSGSVMPGALAISLLSGFMALILAVVREEQEELWEKSGVDTLQASQLWAALTASLLFLIGFRTNKAYGRFWDGTTLLHQMWGEWFDAVSCLIAFSSLSVKKQSAEVAQFRHTLVRLMSLCHGSAMEEISNSDAAEPHICLDVGGLDQKTLQYLAKAKFDKNLGFNRVEVVIHMIQTLVVFNQSNGVLKIPPPILSRVFQTLSRGQVNLANAKKITSTLFPFPYAQLIGILLIIFSIGTPFAMSSIVTSKLWATLFTIVPVLSLFALNYIACQLEMPFGADPNDLPLGDFQEHMNTSLLMLIRPETDLVPHVHELCATDYNDIKANLSNRQPREFIQMDDDFASVPSIGGKHVELAARRRTSLPGKTLHEQGPEPKDTQASEPPPQPAAPQKVEESAREPSLDGGKSGAAEQPLQKSMDALTTKFEELMGHINGLSAQLSKSTTELRDLMANANHLSYQMDSARQGSYFPLEDGARARNWPWVPSVPREHRWGKPNEKQVMLGVSGERGVPDHLSEA